jgi:formylglycine-generating enzyme
MRSLLAAMGGVALVAVAPVACSSFGGADDAIPDAAAPPDDAGGAASDRDVPDAEVPDGASPRCDSGCPGTAGPCGVRAGSTCIDATEVTVADYRAFAQAAAGRSFEVGVPCGQVSIGAAGVLPDEALPMTNVTFCQARAFCLWAGKRLCGLVGGGPLPPAEMRTQADAWFNACTGGTAESIRLLSDAGCQLGASGPAPSGSTCQGGVRGLFDMVGNVWEWIDSTMTDTAPPTARFMGAAYADDESSTCHALSGASIHYAAGDVGFRCCTP